MQLVGLLLALDLGLSDGRSLGILLFLGIIAATLIASVVLLVRHLLKLKKFRDDL